MGRKSLSKKCFNYKKHYTKLKILVTGCAGLIGSHLVDKIIEEKHEVIGIDNLSFGNINNLNDALKSENFLFINQDLNDFDLDNKNIDVIFHLASLKKAWDGTLNSYEIMQENFLMTKKVLELARKNNSLLVFTSTSDVYNNSETFNEKEEISFASSEIERYSYALSKFHSEQMIFNFAREKNINIIIPRIFGCASNRSNLKWSGGHIGLFCMQAKNNEDIIIHGDGLQTRSISHAKDISKGLFDLVVNKEKTLNQIINLGTDEEISILKTAEYIKKEFNSSSNIVHKPFKELFGEYPQIRRRFANIQKAKKLIDYKVNFPSKKVFDEIIKHVKNL